jgi:TolA-binding protein
MDLHPEELIEREACGGLSTAERERLDAHLRQCPACRMERRARSDFQRVADRAPADVRALIARALAPGLVRTATRRTVSPRLRFALGAAALLVGVSGLAAAASGGSLWRFVSRGPIASGAPAVSTGASARSGAARSSEVASPPGGIVEAPSAVPDTDAAPPDVRPSREVREALPAKVSPPRAAPVAEAVAEDAARLFDEANAARRRGAHRDAEVGYRRLMAEHPGSSEAREALVVLGRMLLDDGEARSALPCFVDYARRGGALTAEAMLGRALALAQLGRAEEERSAWSALVDAYPDSVHAERARTRLAALGR